MAHLITRSNVCLVLLCLTTVAWGQTLDEELKAIPPRDLAAQARSQGDAVRGAVVFFQQQMSCAKCHPIGKADAIGLGPDLTALGKDFTDEALVEAVLAPSKTIRKGFEPVSIALADGGVLSGLLVERTKEAIVIRDVARGGELRTIPDAEVDRLMKGDVSIMPAGQVNQLNSRQQFFDLLKYLIEIRDGGAKRAMELQPPQSLLTFTVPEYEQHLDHAGLISGWNDEAVGRGEKIYQRVCANCHGTKDKPGSLPTSLRFAEGKFKNGSDPLSMYRTLTHGFGLMAPQTWMVPSQKYDVIHYIRETYLRPHNPSQLIAVDASYLKKLPKGDTRGPEPSNIVPWSAMDYGPSLTHTYEVPGGNHNLAYKGVAVRLDPGAGGVSRGRHWMIFDTDTLRAAAGWNGSGSANENFIDWHGIQFDGAHGVHPRIFGQTAFVNSTGPGWANPKSGSFADEERVLGRDGKRYGPLPKSWGKFKGQYHYGQQVVFSYSLATTDVLESPGLMSLEKSPPLFLRTFNIGPREKDLVLQVAEHPAEDSLLTTVGAKSAVMLTPAARGANEEPFAFDGNTYVEMETGDAIDVVDKDFSIVARVKTKADGTIWSLTEPGPKWIPDGQTLFIRGGRLTFDIGWVGAVAGKSKIDDGQWHQVAVTWQKDGGRVRLYVDGKLDAEGKLAAKKPLPKSVVRIGFTAPNFPATPFFEGEIAEVRFYQELVKEGLGAFTEIKAQDKSLIARWSPGLQKDDALGGKVRRGLAPVRSRSGPIVAGFSPPDMPAAWSAEKGKLQLRIQAGDAPLRFTLWLPSDSAAVKSEDAAAYVEQFQDIAIPDAARDLTQLTKGGPPRWPEKLITKTVLGKDDGPFASDVLTAPETNPWLAQVRFTGLDFFRDGRIAVCSWDGDVWIVTPEKDKLTWQRIASGLFQPLGLKIVDNKIHLTCRDQLCVLHDLNGDGETDYYECLNNDHQVTEHFHEFAMGLQTDAEGNFYYAKSGCHGLAAIVPHHGTLLKVSKDGSRTEILATGFRAANGVCLNPDGSFVVTDQEGFWNPKNRINWVTLRPDGKPNFYGNMLGYHDVTDTSDAAMVPPLCWITNNFDRSPAELLWVTSDRWPLRGSLLNLSYGYGKVFLVPNEQVKGKHQGGMIELPIPSFPTGVMRGRFSPHDGQLYLCGMFAWAGSATQPGGLYRLRATGQPVHLPAELHATKRGLKLTFTESLDPQSVDVKEISVKSWSLKRTANYGSKHFDEKTLELRNASLSNDGKTLTIAVADLQPTRGMEISYSLRAADGKPVRGVIHNTIYELAE